MGRLKRACVYCLTEECDEWLKPRFHLGPLVENEEVTCYKCERPSTLVRETFLYEGGQPYRQVRVEFDYDVLEGRYHGLAIVTNEDMKSGGVHTLKTPLVKTDKRALAVAMERLSNLSSHQAPDSLAGHVNFDLPLEDVKRQIRALVPVMEQLASDQSDALEDCPRAVPCVC